jgi:predicted ATPase/DNA-binding CsgD family transcriptional regulator
MVWAMGGNTVAAAGAHGFAPALTSFVGRSGDAEKITRLLGEYRLVTVTGPGGVGKTRLASEVARRMASGRADGASLVELTAVQDPALVPAAVATALGVQQAPGMPVTESLAGVLARQQLLLVLDNCEHLLPAVAQLCAGLLTAADDLTLLATSREPVGVAGEARYRLRPLAVPDLPQDGDGSAAIALFADRARQADPEFSLDSETEPLVARIVNRLDGMPLAIELAAARVEALGLQQLLDRLDDRFTVLTSGDRLAAARQQSLAATVDWSYQLLSERDRRAFRRLAVFPGPFTLEAATAVAGGDAEPAVLHLVDCSLLTPPRPGPDSQPRYLMLETLRAFGLDRLADGLERPDAEAALTRYALAVAEQAAASMQSSTGELAAARRLDAEDAAVHQALTWALDHDPPAALRLAVALAPWWQLRGRYVAGYAQLQRAAEHTSQRDGPWYAARYWLGQLAIDMSDYPAASGHLTAVCDALGAGPPSPDAALALAVRTRAQLNLGELAQAAADSRRALSLARENGYLGAQAMALLGLSWAAAYSSDPEGHLSWSRQAQQVAPARIPGPLARMCLLTYASALLQSGSPAEAQQVCADGLAGARAAEDPGGQANFLYYAAMCARSTGQIASAGGYLGECIRVATITGSQLRLIDCLDECGFLCAATGRWADAVTLWAAYAARLEEIGVADTPQDAALRLDLLGQAGTALGPALMGKAGARGAAMSLDTAAELALLLTGPDPQISQEPSSTLLSTRERELVTLVAGGQTDAQIAGRLFISVSTVRSHLDRIRDKTGCRRRAELTRLALQEGLV